MLRDFKFMRRNTGKNPNAEEAENVPVNPKDLSNHQSVVDPSRPPLNAIQDPAQTSTYISNLESSSMKVSQVERTPTKPKYKNPDTMMPFRTPEKQGAMSKIKCGRGQKSEYQSTSGFVESKDEGRVVTNAYTPRAARTVERGNSSYSQCNSTQSTPSKSVIKPPSSGYSLATVSRPPPTGRAFNFAALAKGIPSSSGSSTVVNTVEVPYFELKEDPSFWMEHNVQVLIRVRPLNSMEKSSFGFNRCLKQETSQCISWIGQPETRFTFDHVACEAIDQETLFRMVGLPMVENCLSGYNSCMFAYGQTGSGKTFTMLGEIEGLEVKPSPNRGMTPRIFEFLFARIRAEEESRRDERLKYNCKCSFLEIYNEQITDLLDPSSTNLMLREDMKKGVYVENLSEFEVHTVGDILQLLTQGSSNRKVAATNMNRESSRSHSVFTCVIESKWEKDSTTNFRFARLNLVDLAGSERQKSSGAEGERLKEAANINRSLSTLGHVIMVLVDVANGKLKHVPYRDSRLTFLLQDSLGGNSKTMIIANVSPSVCSAAETLNTLKFAQRAKLIQNNAIINEDSSGDVVVLKRQIQLLKEELSALKREKVTRSLSFGPALDRDIRNKDEDDCNIWKADEDNMIGGESCGILRVSCKQLKSVEATLAGALRREQMAETSIKQLEAEIEQLNRLVSQREEDTRCSKMMLKFREDKIQRMESLLGGLISADDYLLEENTALTEEIQQLRARIDKNPEVTRFAVENIRLLGQVRRFQDFYEEGEREMLMTEVSELRKQLNASIDGNAWIPKHLDTKGSINDKENDLIQKELRRTLAELEESKEKLASCLNDNTKLRGELEELRSSLGATTFGTEELNCSSEVIKESVVEVPHSNNQSIPDNIEEKSSRNHMKHAEDIMDLQLELDILKIILQEERLQRAETEEMVQSIKGELQSSKDTVVSITKEFEKLQDELKNAKLVIDALESQQIVSINENLRISNIQYEELLKRKELEMSSGKEHSEREDSPLEAKFRKMHESLEKAKRLNKGYQSSLAVQASNDDETEEVRKQIEAETAEVIVCLQEELSLLQQEVHESKMKEIETSEKLALLKTEMEVMESNLHSRCEDNAKLSERLEHNEKELRTLSEAWEATTYEIEAILAGGHEALKDASDQIDLITTSTHKPSWISEQFATMKKHIIEKELVTEELNQCLRDAIDKRNDVESMLRSLRGAALVMAETHQQECTEKDKKIILLTSNLNDKSSTVAELERLIKHGRDQLRKTSSCATAALVIVSRLSELTSDYQDSLIDKDVQFRELQEICTNNNAILQNQARKIDEAHEKNHSLQVELEASQECCTEIRLQLSEEQNNLEAIQVKLEESEECKILEAQEKLKDLNYGVLTLKSCMNEYRTQSGDHHNGTTPEKSKCFAADECESRTGTRTEQDVIETSNCLSRAGTLKEQKINENSIGSERALKNVKSRDATIILLKKEIESALRSLEEVQAEMGKLRREKEEISLSEKHSRESIESLMSPAVLLQDAMDNFESDFKLKISSLDDKLVKMEDTIQESCSSWFQQRELLEAELDDAKVVADQKSIEASCIFEKFEEFQDTMKEADIMINELMIANEALKLNAQELRVRENNLTSERDTLLNDVQSIKLSNNLKDQNYEKLEKQHDTDFVTMKRMFLELEDAVSQVQTASNEEWASLSSDFLSMKSQLHEATRLIRSSLEEVWSEIIVKDCAVSVLHLCHMGILLETANGLNAENGLLHHGLCESNSVISELRDSNFRSKRELEMCRVLEGKLLTDIKKGFDRVSNQVDEAGELTLKLTSFEKKIQHLQFQEEAMLQKSNDMGSELATLMKELDCSNRDALASIMDQERSQKNIAEKYESREEHFLMELLAKDLESFILSSELKNMSLLKADVEATSIGFLEMIENFRKDIVLRSLDAYSCEFMLLDKEIECDLRKKEVEKAMKKHQGLLLELDGKSSAIAQLETVNKALQQDVHLLKESVHSGESLKGALQQVMEEKKILSGQVQNLEFQYEQLLDKCENSELEVAEMETVLAEMNATIESLRGNLETVTSQRDDLDNKILSLTKDLEMARAIAQENETIAIEAREIAESHKLQAEEKEEEVKLCERSIQELEFTINVLQQKTDIIREDAERQHLQSEELELELQAVKGQLHDVQSNDINIRRHLEEKEKKLLDTLQRVQLLEREIGVRDDELSRCKAHIAELNVHAEAQACEYKQKFKALEAMVEQVKSEVPSSLSSNSSSNKLEKNASKSRGSGSPFKCIGLGLVQQMKSEKDEELTASRQRIEELEALVSSRQKEMLMLKARLASTESMTHDVMRDLLGVKLNMNSYATLMDNQQLHSLIEEAQHHNAEVQAKEHEVANLKLQIDEFIKERNGWLEEIERKQADMMAARVALEKLRQQDQFHKTENDMLKRENVNHKKRVMELEVEVKKLSGQQNIQQRIHHHAKIKDENNVLRSHNEDLSNKLKKTEATLSRVKDELAQYRAANGRNPYIHFDEEQRLDRKLKESEEERLQLAQKLVGLCTSVLQAAGITRPTSEVSLSVAEAALEQLTNRTVSLEMELQDVKLKNRILDERSRLSDLRPQTSATASRANENRHAQNLVSQTPFLSALDR